MNAAVAPLAVHGLRVTTGVDPAVTIVDQVTFAVAAGEVLGILGGPGSGAGAVADVLLDRLPGGRTRVSGEVRVGLDELLVLRPDQRRRVQRGRVAGVLPDAEATFDPALAVGDQLVEVLRWGAGLDRRAAQQRLEAELRWVGLEPEVLDGLPTATTAGQLQRAAVALAAAVDPEVVVATGPTSRLDPTDASEVLRLVRALARERGAGVLLVTGDPAVVARTADRVVVLYAGRLHESGSTATVLGEPAGPYTRALLASTPRLDRPHRRQRALLGVPPWPPTQPPGCRFAPRCPFREPVCGATAPDEVRLDGGHRVRCHFAAESGWLDRLAAFYGGER